MLKDMITLQRWVKHLIDQLDMWEAEFPEKVRSLVAIERLCYMRTCLSAILRKTSEIIGIATTSEQEDQQHPAFWSKAEKEINFLYQQDSELDGVWILVLKMRAIGKEHPNCGRINGLAPMQDLAL